MNVRPLPAWTNGLGRVLRAPAVVLVLWICSLSITIPPAIALNAAIETHLGSSLEADPATDGMNYDWLQEFRAQASPLGRSLRPDVIGFAAVLDNASALADVNFRPMVVVVSASALALSSTAAKPITSVRRDRPRELACARNSCSQS